jgi:hypothetical protein
MDSSVSWMPSGVAPFGSVLSANPASWAAATIAAWIGLGS